MVKLRLEILRNGEGKTGSGGFLFYLLLNFVLCYNSTVLCFCL